jgi:hypothetical protein
MKRLRTLRRKAGQSLTSIAADDRQRSDHVVGSVEAFKRLPRIKRRFYDVEGYDTKDGISRTFDMGKAKKARNRVKAQYKKAFPSSKPPAG